MTDEYEEIVCEYTEIQKGETVPKTQILKYFPNRQIATICDTVENPETHKIDTTISKPGMTKEEIMHHFPPYRGRCRGLCNAERLIGSIIYEAYRKEALLGKLEPGNVRSFWYTHLKAILVGMFQKEDNQNLDCIINKAWGCVIDSGVVTYEEMNITSEKESGRLSVVKDSPFNNIIIAVEKLSFFNSFSWLPKLFNCTLITAGGQPSRAVTRRFIFELKELGVDLGQDFYMCTASDLDPSGYHIQEAFKKQLEKAIEFYGGTGKIEISRLFIRKDQVTPELLIAQGIPWGYKNKEDEKKELVDKMQDTIWERFCEKTDGGLYIPKPGGWTGKVIVKDGKEMVRALLEMNVFPLSIIEHALIKELLKIIRETNDETKIMIPEIMRVFNELKSEVEEKEDEKQERLPELFEKKEKLEEQIEKLENKLSEVKQQIDEDCKDIDGEISELEDERQEELQPVSKAYNFRMNRYRQFKEEHVVVFNPIEQSLKSNIEEKLTEIDHRFQDLEKRDSIKKEISSLCIDYTLLIDENISCFEQPAPTFKAGGLLEKAAINRDLNIEKVRDSFTSTFIDAMRQIWHEDTRNMTFELGEIAELKDISQEVKEAIDETEKELNEQEEG